KRLEQSLRRRFAASESMEYELTWKRWDMPSGPPICALRASARPISDNGCSGWPTPKSRDTHGVNTPEHLKKKRAAGHGCSELVDTVKTVMGWSTPTERDHSRGNHPPRPHDTGHPLSQQVATVGWTTPSSREWKDTPGMATTGLN